MKKYNQIDSKGFRYYEVEEMVVTAWAETPDGYRPAGYSSRKEWVKYYQPEDIVLMRELEEKERIEKEEKEKKEKIKQEKLYDIIYEYGEYVVDAVIDIMENETDTENANQGEYPWIDKKIDFKIEYGVEFEVVEKAIKEANSSVLYDGFGEPQHHRKNNT